MLRVAAAADLLWCGYTLLAISSCANRLTLLAAVAIASAILLLIGHLTRLIALIAASIELLIICATLYIAGPYMVLIRLGSGFTLVIGLAISCTGPGLFSVDAQRYGRREIIISRND